MIDLIVDIGLIAFDVLSSPILIIVHDEFLNKYVNKHIKRFLKCKDFTSGSKSNKLYIVMLNAPRSAPSTYKDETTVLS